MTLILFNFSICYRLNQHWLHSSVRPPRHGDMLTPALCPKCHHQLIVPPSPFYQNTLRVPPSQILSPPPPVPPRNVVLNVEVNLKIELPKLSFADGTVVSKSFTMWRRHRPATGGRVEKFRHQLHDHKLCRKFHNLYRIKFSEPSCPDRKQSLLINLFRKLSKSPWSSRQQSPFHHLFRKKFVKQSLSCSKHRKHISNRGRRKSAVLDSRVSTRYIFDKTESAEDLPPSADTSQHSAQPRNLPERLGHPHCHCSSPAHVRYVLT